MRVAAGGGCAELIANKRSSHSNVTSILSVEFMHNIQQDLWLVLVARADMLCNSWLDCSGQHGVGLVFSVLQHPPQRRGVEGHEAEAHSC